LEETIHLEHPAVTEAADLGAFGGFNPIVAGIATAAAVGGILVAYYFYRKVYERQRTLPVLKRPDDPIRPLIRPIFAGMENKWWVDELYWAVILNPYISLSRFLADVVDWQFWHDWFHDKVIVGGYNLLSSLLAQPVDQGIIDRTANGIAALTKGGSSALRTMQTGFVRNYALTVFLGVVIIVGYLILR
jgi:NADH-quinone oxidoreductase subunit L